jgi:hypothetical protein
MRRKVAVVGLGPTGAFTARAAYDLGCDVHVFVYGTPNSTPPGAFWLHWIPDDVVGDFSSKPIYIVGKGKPEAYTKLQWATHWHKGLTSSFPKEPVTEYGYNPSEVLPALVPPEVETHMLTYPFSDADVKDLTYAFDYVFQTFPRKVDTESQSEKLPFVAAAKFNSHDPEKNIVVYNGTGDGLIVREASLFGHHFLEFPKGCSLEYIQDHHDLTGYKTITLKDLAPDTQPVPESPAPRLFLIGRFARWSRTTLSHQCYHDAYRIITQGGLND